MELKISAPSLEDFVQLNHLIWRSFYFAQKDHTGVRGMEYFRDLIEVPVLQYEFLTGHTRFLCAFEGMQLLGVIAYQQAHIVLLFVETKAQRRGVGRALVCEALQNVDSPIVTVHAAMGSAEFYRSIGFCECASIREENGLYSQPMEALREKVLSLAQKR